MRYLKKIFIVLLIGIGLIVFRMLAFEFFQVKQFSMEETYSDGSIVVVNKLAYGVRFPMHIGDIPFAEAVVFMFGKADRIHDISWEYRRIPGFARVKQGDVVVFDHPAPWSREKLVKRCVALPGDTIAIINNRRYVGGKEKAEPSSVKFSYCVYTYEKELLEDSLNQYGIVARDHLWQSNGAHHYAMTTGTANAFSNCTLVDSVVMDNFQIGAPGPQLFPHHRQYTRENYGPILVPAKGMTVSLDSSNVILYKDVITQYESNTLEVENEIILINGKASKNYTFQLDYFFLVGDNRYHSMDSRYWGFVPEFSIIGKVGPVIYTGRRN
jgi:signal peptidase I